MSGDNNNQTNQNQNSNAQQNKGLPAEIRNQSSLWLFGIFAALAIERAADKVLRPLLHLLGSSSGILLDAAKHVINTPDAINSLIRFIVFTVLVIRFYLGSVKYYSSNEARGVRDTILGSIHYTLFLLCALSIDQQLNAVYKPSSIPLFGMLMLDILLFDWVWFAFSFHKPGGAMIFRWAVTNTGTVAVTIIVGYIFMVLIKPPQWEYIGLFFIFITSVIDLVNISKGVNIYSQIGKWFTCRFRDRIDRQGC